MDPGKVQQVHVAVPWYAKLVRVQDGGSERESLVPSGGGASGSYVNTTKLGVG